MSRRHTGRTGLKRTCALAALLAWPGTCLAGTATAPPFTVTMTITASCAVVSTQTMTFSNPGALTASVDATSNLVVQCTNTTPYNVSLNAGTGTGATFAARLMSNGATTVTYSLYTDLAHTTVWGTNNVSQTGNGQNQSLTIYGHVPPQNAPAPGTYTDSITVTVTY
jgi:spore coat protein U-like protein